MLDHFLEQDLSKLLLDLCPVQLDCGIEFESIRHIPDWYNVELLHLIVYRMDSTVVHKEIDGLISWNLRSHIS